MRIPYGVADFYSLRAERKVYVDRTGRIPLLEDAGQALLFLRPRRFGWWPVGCKHTVVAPDRSRLCRCRRTQAIEASNSPMRGRYLERATETLYRLDLFDP